MLKHLIKHEGKKWYQIKYFCTIGVGYYLKVLTGIVIFKIIPRPNIQYILYWSQRLLKEHPCTHHPADFILTPAVWLFHFSVLFHLSFRLGFWSCTWLLCSQKLKCATSPCSHIACVCLCASLSLCSQFTDHPTHPASWQCNKTQRVLLTCLPSYWNHMLSPPTPHFFPSPCHPAVL